MLGVAKIKSSAEMTACEDNVYLALLAQFTSAQQGVSISGGQTDQVGLEQQNVRDGDGPLALGRLSGRIGIRLIVNALVITIGLSRLAIRHRGRRQRRWASVIFATAAHGALALQHKPDFTSHNE